MKQLRLLFAYRHISHGGGVPWETRSLAAAARRAGAAVAQLTLPPPRVERAAFIPTPESHGARECLDAQLVTGLHRGAKREIEQFVRDFAPDVAVVVGLFSPLQAWWSWIFASHGIPYIVSPEGLAHPHALRSSWSGRASPIRSLGKRIYFKTVDQHRLKRAARIRALSGYEASLHHGYAPTFVLPAGIERAWGTGERPPRSRKPGGPLKLLYMGRPATHQKGLDIVKDALTMLLPRSQTHIELLIAGPFDERQRQELRASGIRVRFLGLVQGVDKHKLLTEEADYFLHPSRYEGMAKAPREAIASGVPVIASVESNLGELVDEYRAGLTTALDATSLAHAIQVASASPPHMYSDGLRHLASDLAWDKIGRQLVVELVEFARRT